MNIASSVISEGLLMVTRVESTFHINQKGKGKCRMDYGWVLVED